MEAVRSGLFAGNLPVARQHETLRRTKHLKAVVRTAEKLIKVEFGVAQIILERQILVPGGEDQAAIEMDAGLLQSQFVLGPLVAVHLLLFDRRADEAAVRAEGPAMVNAAMGVGIARFGRADLHAAMGADVQHDVDFATAVARDDHIVFGHVAHDIVAGLGNFRLMAKEQPGAGENPLHLQLVQLLVIHHP